MADSDKYVFENEDSDDQKAEEEEQTTLAARDTWVSSVLNSPFFLGYNLLKSNKCPKLGHMGQFCPNFPTLFSFSQDNFRTPPIPNSPF